MNTAPRPQPTSCEWNVCSVGQPLNILSRKGLVGFYKTQTAGICVPLMTLIDFRGFRLIAMSILPLHKIVYGSHDGGKTVHADDLSFNQRMAEGRWITRRMCEG